MKNKAVTPAPRKTKLAQIRPAKKPGAQAARLAADITAREAEAAKKRANEAKVKFKRAKKVWKLARKAAKRAAKRAKQAHKQLTALTKKLKPSKKRTTAKPVIRQVKPAAKKRFIKRKRSVAPLTTSSAQVPEAFAAPASLASGDESSAA